MGLVGAGNVMHERHNSEPIGRPVPTFHHPVAAVLLEIGEGGIDGGFERLGDVGADPVVAHRPQQRHALGRRAHQVEPHHRLGYHPVGYEAFDLAATDPPLARHFVLVGQQVRLAGRGHRHTGQHLDEPPGQAVVDLVSAGRCGEERLRLVLGQTAQVSRGHADQERGLRDAQQFARVTTIGHGPGPGGHLATPPRRARCGQQSIAAPGVATQQHGLQLGARHRPRQAHGVRGAPPGSALGLTRSVRQVVAHDPARGARLSPRTAVQPSHTQPRRRFRTCRDRVAIAALQVGDDRPRRRSQRSPIGRPHPQHLDPGDHRSRPNRPAAPTGHTHQLHLHPDNCSINRNSRGGAPDGKRN